MQNSESDGIKPVQQIENQFLRYVLPSMLTMLLSGFYCIVDGLFIGRAIGDVGLAAINIAWPITALITATGMGIGSGGSVLMSLRQGMGQQAAAHKAQGNTLVLLLGAGLLLTSGFMVGKGFLLKILGGEGRVLEAAQNYASVIIYGCTLQIFGTGLIPLLRNSNKTLVAMLIMIAGLITNVLLDGILIGILHWGMAGAAWATVAAQGVTALSSLTVLYFLNQHKLKSWDFRPELGTLRRILQIGLSPFGLSLSPSIILIFNNWQCLRYGGQTAVATYAVLSYVVASVQYLLSGIGEGVQPLISFCSGAGYYGSLIILKRKAISLVLSISGVLLVLVLSLRSHLPLWFGLSLEANGLLQQAILITSLAFPMLGLIKLFCSFFYAVGESRYALTLIYGDPLLITPSLIMVLPQFFGLEGVWFTFLVAQLTLTIGVFWMNQANQKELRRRDLSERNLRHKMAVKCP